MNTDESSTLANGDTVRITTTRGPRSAIVGRVVTVSSVWQSLNRDSSWLLLLVRDDSGDFFHVFDSEVELAEKYPTQRDRDYMAARQAFDSEEVSK